MSSTPLFVDARGGDELTSTVAVAPEVTALLIPLRPTTSRSSLVTEHSPNPGNDDCLPSIAGLTPASQPVNSSCPHVVELAYATYP
jgi:hypothetical protein